MLNTVRCPQENNIDNTKNTIDAVNIITQNLNVNYQNNIFADDNSSEILIPTILCGGAGSRLWPISRELHPKPFIRLADGQSLLQKAFLRGSLLPGVTQMLTVTHKELFFKIQDELRCFNNKINNAFILEPFSKNTAPAIAAASLQVSKIYGPNAILLILAADHLIAEQQSFAIAVSQAIKLAKNGKLVTFGIKPHIPETGYGYIEHDGNHVLSFVEKPSIETAEKYLTAGNFLWNSGIFCFTAGTMLSEMEKFCPKLLQSTNICIQNNVTVSRVNLSHEVPKKFLENLELDASFSLVTNDSIDFAVMEKSDLLAVVACDIGWSDIGSWSALGDLNKADVNGNRIQGDALVHNANNCTIQSHNRLVGVVGVDNLVVIDTPDAVLIAGKASTQDVKHLYEALKAKGHESHKLHRTVERPWGSYTILEVGSGFKIKRLVIKPRASLSLQAHIHRSEHWIIVSGTAIVINNEERITLGPQQSTYIQAGHKHRLRNLGLEDVIVIEVQTGNYLGEDDIVRFEDDYGRVKIQENNCNMTQKIK